jgi:type VI secretion system protein ImpE
MSVNAELFLNAGDPAAALEALQGEVRKKPSDAKLRIFLFQLMALNGQWERAQRQLEVIKEMDDEAIAMVEVYRDVINCELHRVAVFQGKAKPLVMGRPADWIATLIEAQQAYANGALDTFLELNSKAFEDAEARSGKINGESFEWLADADQRFGPVLEIIFNGHYYWAPLSRIRSIKSEEPTDLRDLVWLPAEVTWSNGGQNIVMIPSRYPSLDDLDGPCLLARRTNWRDLGHDVFEGLGQRMLATDRQEYPLLQVRSIEFDE